MAAREYRFRLARTEDKSSIIAFLNTHWGTRHPLVNIPELFCYYYDPGSGKLNFALAQDERGIVAVAGFVPSNIKIKPDVWVSLWVADKAAKGAGLELMAALPGLCACRTISCNNIRPETRKFYEFLGFATGRMGHFYRLDGEGSYKIARIQHEETLPAGGEGTLALYETAEQLDAGGFIPPEGANPYKDLWYIKRRNFAFPQQKYYVYGCFLPDSRTPDALLCARLIETGTARVLRIADFVGSPALLPQFGGAIDGLMGMMGAEYTDFYCAGIPAVTMAAAGFSERRENDENILPNYLCPPLYENTDYYYFTNHPEGFTMFKADGDQDRPNLALPPE